MDIKQEPRAVHMLSYGEMPDEAWRRLIDAGNDRAHPMRLMSVATVDDRGHPDSRLLVLRGASRDLGCLWFHTDRRSGKIAQLHRCDRLCAVAYDPESQVQLRLTGSASVHADDQLADRHWQQAALATRYLYRTSLSPGQPLPVPDPRSGAVASDDSTTDGRENFAVIEVRLDDIEWHQLSGRDQRRARLRAASGWSPTPLAP